MDEKRDRVYVKWGLTALGVICISVVLVVIFTDLPGFFGVLRGLEAILEPLILGAVFAFLLNPIVRFVDTRLGPLLGAKTKWKAQAVRNVSRGAGVVTAVIVIPTLVSGIEYFVKNWDVLDLIRVFLDAAAAAV